MRPRVLITGASGFVGAAVAETLAAEGYGIVALCRDVERGRRRLGDLGDAVEVVGWNMALPVEYDAGGGIEAVIHAAGQGDPASYAALPAKTMRDNLLGGIHILDFSRKAGVKKFVLVSSGEVYGIVSCDRRIEEDQQGVVAPLSPRSAYPLSKMAMEGLTLAHGRENNRHVAIARLCHVYGPGIAPTDSRIAAQFPRTAAQGRDIVLKSPGLQKRSLCYITDAAAGVAAVMERGGAGEAYNVADEATEVTVRDFAGRIAAAAGVRVVFEIPTTLEQKAFNPMPQAVLHSGKLRGLGWRANVALARGITETLAFFRETPLSPR